MFCVFKKKTAYDVALVTGFRRCLFRSFIAGSPAAGRNGRTLMTDSDKREPKPGDDEHVALSDPEFKDQLALVIPHLRAFGRSLSGNRDVADDPEIGRASWRARVCNDG